MEQHVKCNQAVQVYKRLYKFVQFSIKDFYPFIMETLLHEAMQLLKEYELITRKRVEVKIHTHKSALYNDGEPWVKKEMSDSFNVTLGVCDGAVYLIFNSKKVQSKNIGLHKMTDLPYQNIQVDQLQKKSLFRQKGLQMSIDRNLKVIN